MATLHLTLKKEWFDMILSGEKKEEYREVKWYWALRLFQNNFGDYQMFEHCARSAMFDLDIKGNRIDFKRIDTIIFKNGYSKTAPQMEVECLGITMGIGNKEWGAPDEEVFIISLGKIISSKN